MATELDKLPQKEPEKIKNVKVELNKTHVMKIFKMGSSAADTWFPLLKKYCDEAEINSVFRLAAFLAQVHVETGGLKVLVENLNYSAVRLVEVFPKYFKSKEMAYAHERKPEKIANRVYANRMGNGDEASGDGWRYRGRGGIQLTGFYNYDKCNKAGIPCLGENAPYLETPEGAVRSAVWYWNSKALNRVSDQGNFREVCVRVNGGTNGYKERLASYNYNLTVLYNIEGAQVEPDPDAENPQGPQVAPEVGRDTNEYMPTPESNHKTFSETIVPGNAQYPWNKAMESRSGHLIEIDDTPGRERLQYYHRTGTYWEMQPNGSLVTKVMKDNRLFVRGNAFADYQQDLTQVVEGSIYTRVGSNVTYSTSGRFGIDAPSDFNVNAPNSNFSGAIQGRNVNAKFYKMIRGTEFGNVADMKVRSAVSCDYSKKAGGLGSDPNPDAYIKGYWEGGNWTYSKSGDAEEEIDRGEGGLLDFTPAAQEMAASFVGFENGHDLFSYGSGNRRTITQGNKKEKTNGSVYDGCGGDRVEETSGGRVDHTGDQHHIKSDHSVKIEAPLVSVHQGGVEVLRVEGGVVIAKFLVHEEISKESLPEPSAAFVGKAITAFVEGKIRHYRCLETLIWEEME